MTLQTNRSIYKRPITHKGTKDKDYHMRAYNLSSELSRLEYEKELANMKMTRIERRMEEIQREMHEINNYFREKCEVVEDAVIPPNPKSKHVTFEY